MARRSGRRRDSEGRRAPTDGAQQPAELPCAGPDLDRVFGRRVDAPSDCPVVRPCHAFPEDEFHAVLRGDDDPRILATDATVRRSAGDALGRRDVAAERGPVAEVERAQRGWSDQPGHDDDDDHADPDDETDHARARVPAAAVVGAFSARSARRPVIIVLSPGGQSMLPDRWRQKLSL